MSQTQKTSDGEIVNNISKFSKIFLFLILQFEYLEVVFKLLPRQAIYAIATPSALWRLKLISITMTPIHKSSVYTSDGLTVVTHDFCDKWLQVVDRGSETQVLVTDNSIVQGYSGYDRPRWILLHEIVTNKQYIHPPLRNILFLHRARSYAVLKSLYLVREA